MQSSNTAPIIAIGELLWDLLPVGPRLGGTTTNFSVLSARLGADAALVSRVGRDRLGQAAISQLREMVSSSHFSLESIQTSEALPTGTVSVTLDDEGRPRYTIESPVAWDEITLTPELIALAQRAAVVCFGTLAQRHATSCATIRALVEAASAECVRVFDVNLRMPFCTAEVLHWGLRHATVIKVSDEELPQVMQMLAATGHVATALPAAPADGTGAALTEWATQAARALLAVAPQSKLVAITLGPHGSLLADRSSVYRHPGFPVQVVDTIGAGDAFTAGLAYSYIEGASLQRISTVANLCGSYVASQQGATPELPATLLQMIQETLA